MRIRVLALNWSDFKNLHVVEALKVENFKFSEPQTVCPSRFRFDRFRKFKNSICVIFSDWWNRFWNFFHRVSLGIIQLQRLLIKFRANISKNLVEINKENSENLRIISRYSPLWDNMSEITVTEWQHFLPNVESAKNCEL